MPNPIKAFFEKKRAEARFKAAGPGHKLGDQTSEAARREEVAKALNKRAQQSSHGHARTATAGPSAAQQRAAQAALSRSQQSDEVNFEKKRSQAVIRAQVQKELEGQRKAEAEALRLKETFGEKPLVEVDAASACPGVFFHCSLIGPEVLPKEQMKTQIKQFLYDQLNEEKGLTACLMIHTFAKDSERAKFCIETLCKYLDNIVENPDDEKYRKIRKTNKVYQEKVAPLEGHDHFLEAVGFETQVIDDQEFWVFSGEVDSERMEFIKTLREALVNSEPIRAELDRGLRVLKPQQVSRNVEVPPDFYAIGADELKREMQAKSDLVERETMLRTKAMREREGQLERRRYRYTLIRIRFPNDIVLQGTFSVYESYRRVHDFVSECLEFSLPFVLYETAGGHRLEVADYEKSLLDLSLVPSAQLTFAWHPEVADEISQQLGPKPHYLKDEVRSLLSDA